MTIRVALIIALCCAVIGAAYTDSPPTYKGLVCMGWTKPETVSIQDGDSPGDELVINTQLTEAERQKLYYARRAAHRALEEERKVEESILAAHRLLYPLRVDSDWLRQDGCGVTPMIRLGDYHISQFVPSNPNYPSDEAAKWLPDGANKCRKQFSEMRKRAVAAVYGRTQEEDYVPKKSKGDKSEP